MSLGSLSHGLNHKEPIRPYPLYVSTGNNNSKIYNVSNSGCAHAFYRWRGSPRYPRPRPVFSIPNTSSSMTCFHWAINPLCRFYVLILAMSPSSPPGRAVYPFRFAPIISRCAPSSRCYIGLIANEMIASCNQPNSNMQPQL